MKPSFFRALFILLTALTVLILFSGCTLPETGQVISTSNQVSYQSTQSSNAVNNGVKWQKFTTFQLSAGSPEYVDGKPVIRLYSTTWCSHCQWIKKTFDETVKPYVMEGKIIAYHWQLDSGDNSLTSEVESKVPDAEVDIFYRFSPRGSVPAFVFGNKYYRIGNGYEVQNDLQAEKKEFKQVIEELIKNASEYS